MRLQNDSPYIAMVFMAIALLSLFYPDVGSEQLSLFGLDDMAGAALVSAGLGTINSLFGSATANNASAQAAAATKYYADKQFESVQATNQANKEENEANRAFNLEMWNKQNAYNDPAAQRARLEAAGYNPFMNEGNQASLATAPSSIPMQSMDYSSIAQQESANIMNAANMRIQAFNSLFDNAQKTFGLLAEGRNQARADKNYNLAERYQSLQEKVGLAQIQNLATQNLSLANTMSLQDEEQRQLRLNGSIQRELTASQIRLNATQIESLQQEIDNFIENFRLQQYIARTGRISASAAWKDAQTAKGRLDHDIDRWFSHNIPGMPEWQRKKISEQLSNKLMDDTWFEQIQSFYNRERNTPVFGLNLGRGFDNLAWLSHKMTAPITGPFSTVLGRLLK